MSMLSTIFERIKSRIPQTTTIFDKTTETDVEISTRRNIIIAEGKNGDWTITKGESETNSPACFNRAHDFVNGKVVLDDVFFGTARTNLIVDFHKININYALNRDTAYKMVDDSKTENIIIVYFNGMSTPVEREVYGETMDQYLKVRYSIGIIYKINLGQMDTFNCSGYDKLLINIVRGSSTRESSILNFSSVLERNIIQNYYVVDYEFYHFEDLFDIQFLHDNSCSFDFTFRRNFIFKLK